MARRCISVHFSGRDRRLGAACEDTIIFPASKRAITSAQKELTEQLEDPERKMSDKDGGSLAKLLAIVARRGYRDTSPGRRARDLG